MLVDVNIDVLNNGMIQDLRQGLDSILTCALSASATHVVRVSTGIYLSTCITDYTTFSNCVMYAEADECNTKFVLDAMVYRTTKSANEFYLDQPVDRRNPHIILAAFDLFDTVTYQLYRVCR